MALTISDQGLDLIKRFEGYMSHRYVCPAGKLTIGYGHVLQSGETIAEPMTEAQATALLRHDLDTRYSPAVYAMIDLIPVTQAQFDALVSFAYNVGLGALKGSTLLKKINTRDLVGAAEEFLRWDKIAGKPSDGLLRRRVAERALFMKEKAQ